MAGKGESVSEPERRHDAVPVGEVKQALVEQAARIFGREKVLAVALVIFGGAGSLGGWAALAQSTQGQVDAGVAPVVERIAAVERRTEALEQALRNQTADVHETQVDIRALYKAVMTGAPQARLERAPVPVVQDGGP